MVRPLLAFLGAELVIGAVALVFVLSVCDLYLEEGRRVLTVRGERVLGPVLRRLAPFVMRLIVWSRPVRAAAVRFAVRAGRFAVAAWWWARQRLQTAWAAAVAARSRRRGVAPRHPLVRVLARGAGRARDVGRGVPGRARVARRRLRARTGPARSGDGKAGHAGRGRSRRPGARRVVAS